MSAGPFGRLDHLLELFHDRLRHPDLVALLADIGGDLLHHIELPPLVIFQIDFFQLEAAAAGRAFFFSFT